MSLFETQGGNPQPKDGNDFNPSGEGPVAPPSATLVLTAQSDAQDASLIRVESGILRGFTGVQMIGNASEICNDGKERARAALETLGIRMPQQRLMISFIPADVKKDGSQFDLAIAVSLALLLRGGGEQAIDSSKWVFVAELGISGQLRPVRGIIAHALAALHEGAEGIVIASGNMRDASRLIGVAGADGSALKVMAFDQLQDVLSWVFDGHGANVTIDDDLPVSPRSKDGSPDFDDMVLDAELRSCVLAAATGMHSMLLRGSPGTGKSMLAARIASVLPPLEASDHITAMRIHSSCSERLPPGLFAGRPPVRAPHHQASAASVLGAGDYPGEMSLAHGGVLFLDELPEFRRDLLEALREPLETGEVRVSRARRRLVWKARVMLIAACNNCPCGWAGSVRKKCVCGSPKLLAYRQRLSGPILDRIDIHINMPEALNPARIFLDLHEPKPQQESVTAELAGLVLAARAFGGERNRRFGVIYNREIPSSEIVRASGLSASEFGTMVVKSLPVQASSRSIIRTLRVARSLADLAGSEKIRDQDIALAWSWQADPAAKARGEHLL